MREKICKICAAPLIWTESGCKCSFCNFVELLSEEELEKERRNQPELIVNEIPRNIDMSKAKKQGTNTRTKWILRGIIIFLLIDFVIPVITIIGLAIRKEKEESNYDKFPKIKEIDIPDMDKYHFEELEEIDFTVSMPDIDLEGLDRWQGNYNERVFRTKIMSEVISEIFGVPAENVTEEELQSIQYFTFKVDYSDCTIEVKYSTEDYREYPEDYAQAINAYEDIILGYNDEFQETIKTITLPYNEWELPSDIYVDIAVFENVKAINLCDDTYIDFSFFPNLTMVDAGSNCVEDLLMMNLPAEQIEDLRLSMAIDLEKLILFTNLKNLHIDGTDSVITDLDGLYGLPWLKELTIVNTYIMDVDFLYYMPRLENLRLLYNQDLDNLDGLQALEELVYFQIEY